uniref:Uncharacterized protein n=1 Tax=Marmota marmota marmota TaxID=9994 RepID=A0A8C6AA30_MARMA
SSGYFIHHSSMLLKFYFRQQHRKNSQAIWHIQNDSNHKYLKGYSREEFERNGNATKEDIIQMIIAPETGTSSWNVKWSSHFGKQTISCSKC